MVRLPPQSTSQCKDPNEKLISQILNMIENLLAFHDAELLDRFVTFQVTSQVLLMFIVFPFSIEPLFPLHPLILLLTFQEYAWPMLKSLFVDILPANAWPVLMDNVLSSHPGFLLLCVVAYLSHNRVGAVSSDVDSNIRSP